MQEVSRLQRDFVNAVLILLAVLSAYIAGFVGPLGYSFSGLVDSQLIFSAIAPAGFFIVSTSFGIRLAWLANAGFDRFFTEKASTSNLDDEGELDQKLIDFDLDRSNLEIKRLERKILSLKVILFIFVVIGFIWFTRLFLSFGAAVFFLLLMSVWIVLAAFAIAGTNKLSDKASESKLTAFSESIQALFSPFVIYRLNGGMVVLALVLVASSYTLGVARALSLSQAPKVCWILKDSFIEASLLAENRNGYFVFSDRENESSNFWPIYRHPKVDFIPSRNVLLIKARCDGK